MNKTLYCKCGNRAEFDAPERWLARLEKAFWQVHQGEGHAPIDRAEWYVRQEYPQDFMRESLGHD